MSESAWVSLAMGVTDRICLDAETCEIRLLASRHGSALVCGCLAVIAFADVFICFAPVVFCGNVTVCQRERKRFSLLTGEGFPFSLSGSGCK